MKSLIDDLSELEGMLTKLAPKKGEWRDPALYALAVILFHLLTWAVKQGKARE